MLYVTTNLLHDMLLVRVVGYYVLEHVPDLCKECRDDHLVDRHGIYCCTRRRRHTNTSLLLLLIFCRYTRHTLYD